MVGFRAEGKTKTREVIDLSIGKKYWKRLFPYLLLMPSVVILVSIGVYPFVYALVLGFENVVLTKPWLPARFMGIENYKWLLVNPYFHKVIQVSIVFTFAAVLMEFALGLGLALLLQRRIGRVVRSVLIIPMVTTPIIVGLMWRFLFYPQYGLLTYWGELISRWLSVPIPVWLEDVRGALFLIIMADVWHWTPFVFLVLSAGLVSLPRWPFEAAELDGANRFQMLRHVTLPLLKRVIFICLVIRGMDAFRTFDKVYALTEGGPSNATEVLSMYLHRVTFRFFYVSRGAALAILALIIILVMTRVALGVFQVEEHSP